jgi:hypothetical protein
MKLLRNILFILSLTLFVCCEDVKEYPWNDAWNDSEQTGPESPDEPEEPENPETPEEPENPETPEDPENPEEPENPGDPEDPQDPPVQNNAKARLVWIDAAANFKDYANSESQIDSDMQRLKETGFTGVIVDVRPTNTGVLFKSSVEAALTRVDAWLSSGYKWVDRTASFDYLQAFIDAGEKHGLDV